MASYEKSALHLEIESKMTDFCLELREQLERNYPKISRKTIENKIDEILHAASEEWDW